ncbi:hypothetical protein ACJJTC_003752 [Scirpophaga incertulas]
MDVPSPWKDTNIFYNILCFLITENEKVFDRSDAKLYWKTVFHALCLSHHAYVGLFATSLDLVNHPEPEIQQLYAFRAAYLTGWGFTIQVVFAIVALLHDALEWADKQDHLLAKRFTYWRDVFYNALVMPFSLFISAMFWCIFWVDRELVFPAAYDVIIPWWFNHCVHTNITIIVLVEILFIARRQPTNKKLELIIHSIVSFGYAIVLYSIYFTTNRWLYKVFGVMTWWQVCLYQSVIWISGFSCYFVHFPINRLIHGTEDETTAGNGNTETGKSLGKSNRTVYRKNMVENKLVLTKDNLLAHEWNLKNAKGSVENSSYSQDQN